MRKRKDKGLDVLEKWIRDNADDFEELFSFDDADDEGGGDVDD